MVSVQVQEPSAVKGIVCANITNDSWLLGVQRQSNRDVVLVQKGEARGRLLCAQPQETVLIQQMQDGRAAIVRPVEPVASRPVLRRPVGGLETWPKAAT